MNSVYVLYTIYYLPMYYVRFSLTYLPTQKSDILYGRSPVCVVVFTKRVYYFFSASDIMEAVRGRFCFYRETSIKDVRLLGR